MGFNLYFGGAEQPLSAKILANEGVTHQMVSFYEWEKRHDLIHSFADFFDPSTYLCLTPGVSKRIDIKWDDFCRQYVEFVIEHEDELDLVLEIDSQNCPLKARIDLRHALYDLKDKLVVFPTDEGQIHFLGNHQIGLNATTARLFKPGMIKAPIHLVNTTSKKAIYELRPASISTYAWLSPRRYGEAWLYEHGKLVHFPASELSDALASRAQLIEAFEVDPVLAETGDPEALTVLAVRSLQAFAADVARILSKQAHPTRMASRTPDPVIPAVSRGTVGARESLPIMVLESPGDQGGFAFEESLARQCDSCYLSARCPKFEVGSECSYKVPVEIRSKADWLAASKALIEMQMQRVTFGYFAEQTEGGPLHQRVGQEIDRFYKMLKDQKELETADAPAPKGGVMSAIFGPAPELPERTGDD